MLLSGFKWLYEHSFTEPYDLLRNDIHLNIPTVQAIELEKIREEADKLCAKDSAPDDYKIGISDLLKAIRGSK